MRPKRIVVCGGRNYFDSARVWAELDKLAPEEVAQGGATGADRLASEWAIARKVKSTTYLANWMAHGKAAGPLRNQKMLDEFKPDAVLAFPGGKGTADMVRRDRLAGVIVVEAP